jgi:hypothetical protein|tara:strand:+ start:472 stop:705 length:234 start_codon:yes stop_codon:yes gene_type:complete
MFSNDTPLTSFAIYDVVRLLVIQIFTQLSFSIFYKNTPFITPLFLHTISFLTVGTLIFWFIFYGRISKMLEKDIKDR